MYKAIFYDIDKNPLYVQRGVTMRRATEQINGRGMMIFDFPTFVSPAGRGDFIENPIFGTRAMAQGSPWQVNIQMIYEPTDTIMFEGWMIDVDIEEILTKVTVVGVHSYFQKKLVLTQGSVSQPLDQIISSFWGDINARRQTNISITGSAPKAVGFQWNRGMLFAQIMDRLVQEGFEYTFRDGVVTIGQFVGKNVTKALNYHYLSPEASTTSLNKKVKYSGKRYANLCVASDDTGFASYQQPLQSWQDEIGTYQNFRDDKPEKCRIYVERFADGFKDYKLEAKPEHFQPGEIRAGDYVSVNVLTGFLPFDMKETLIRVVQVEYETTEAGFVQRVQLSNDPVQVAAQEELARRIKELEDNQ